MFISRTNVVRTQHEDDNDNDGSFGSSKLRSKLQQGRLVQRSKPIGFDSLSARPVASRPGSLKCSQSNAGSRGPACFGRLPQEARRFLDAFQKPWGVKLVIRSLHWWSALEGRHALGCGSIFPRGEGEGDTAWIYLRDVSRRQETHVRS